MAVASMKAASLGWGFFKYSFIMQLFGKTGGKGQLILSELKDSEYSSSLPVVVI